MALRSRCVDGTRFTPEIQARRTGWFAPPSTWILGSQGFELRQPRPQRQQNNAHGPRQGCWNTPV